MKPLKRLLSITAAVCILLASFPAAALDVTSYGACVMDCESGEILFSKDGQTAARSRKHDKDHDALSAF